MREVFAWIIVGRTLGMAGLVAGGLLLTGCGGGAGGPPPEVAVEVVISEPALSSVEETVTAVGTVEANERVELKPEASGLVEAIPFVEGQRVKAGEKLFQLDAKKELASLSQAAAEEKLAQANLTRARALMGTKAIAQQELEQLESQVAVKAAIHRLEKERLTEREVLAPFDGVLGPRLVSPGQYVNAGTPLATLVDDTRVKVRFRIPERQLSLVKLQQEGRLRVSAYPDQEFIGRVDLINPEVDQGTRTVEIRLLVPNPDGLLKPGMFARVELVVGARERAVVIPEGALVPSLDHFSVYVVEDGIARLKRVTVGVRLPGRAEIREGLSATQRIVVSGTQKLVDGMKVTQSAPAAAPVAAPAGKEG